MKFMGTTQGMRQKGVIFGKKLVGNFQTLFFENWSDVMEANFSKLERFV